MKNNIIKKLAAVFVTAAMIGTGFSLVSAADVSDIEIQSEEAVEVSEEPVIEFAEGDSGGRSYRDRTGSGRNRSTAGRKSGDSGRFFASSL